MKIKLLLYCCILVICFACKSYKTKYPYSLEDFRPELRTYLEKIIESSEVGNLEDKTFRYLKDSISDKELLRMFKSEHPILRAEAFSFLVNTKPFDNGNLLLKNLDDTAKIHWWTHTGKEYGYLSDFYITTSKSKTKILQSKLIDTVLTSFNKLEYASQFALYPQALENKYYETIKRKFLTYTIFDEVRNNYTIALSRFKKKEDVIIIKEAISNWKRTGNTAFIVIEENPDTSYFKILEEYYQRISFQNSKETLQSSFFLYPHFGEKFYPFLKAIVKFKNVRSTEILNDLIQRKIYPDNFTYIHGDFYYSLNELLKENYCKDYEVLINKLKPRIIEIEKNSEKYKIEPSTQVLDSIYNGHHYKDW